MFLYTVSCRAQLFVCPSDQKQVRQVYEAGHWIFFASEKIVFKRKKDASNIQLFCLNK